jgi:serralysin
VTSHGIRFSSVVTQLVNMSDTQLDAQYELLAKALAAYSDPSLQPFANKVFEAAGYVVNRVFDDPANEFQALGFSSKDGSKPPLLVLPGGRAGNPISVGNEEFVANRQAIQDWLVNITNDRQANPQGLKPDVTGVSRGGALTQLVASEFPTLIGSAVSFVSPGIDRETADKFIENGGDPSQVRHYITDGDWRSLIGEAFIPGTVTVGTYEIPIAPEVGQVDYATRKHSSGILADFSSLFPDTSDLTIAQIRAATDKPADLSLAEISVDELNQSDFTFQGEDWQAVLDKIETNNPNLTAFTDRENAEEVRDHLGAGAILPLFAQAVTTNNPLPPEQVNRPTVSDDVLFGTECSDHIIGLAGDDYIRGGDGDDLILGNEGRDALIGNAGNDILNGGADHDILTGSAGNDRFIFGENAPFQTGGLGIDRINDFRPGEDLIGLTKATFSNLGADLASAFGTVTDDAAAEASSASIVYNTGNGKLFYNANGADAGFGDGGQFANIFGQPALSAENFILT